MINVLQSCVFCSVELLGETQRLWQAVRKLLGLLAPWSVWEVICNCGINNILALCLWENNPPWHAIEMVIVPFQRQHFIKVNGSSSHCSALLIPSVCRLRQTSPCLCLVHVAKVVFTIKWARNIVLKKKSELRFWKDNSAPTEDSVVSFTAANHGIYGALTSFSKYCISSSDILDKILETI